MEHTLEQHIKAMHTAGLTPPADIVMDGKIHRFPTNGKGDDKAGYYAFWDHGDGFISGFFGDWRSGIQRTWHSREAKNLSGPDREELDRQMRETRKAAKREREAKAKEAAKKAVQILTESAPASERHPYLKRKKVKPYGISQLGNILVVPVFDRRGAIRGLQWITADGQKFFLEGTPVTSHFYRIKGKKGPVYITEGYATGASIHEATGAVTCIAFNAGNLLSVAEAIRKENPEDEIVIVADNDQWTDGNPGLTKAKEASETVGAFLAAPEFQDVTTRPTDFNDLHVLEGIEAVQRQLEQAIKPKEKQEDDGAILERLASLSPFEYEKVREKEAERLGVRVSVLDQEVRKRRPKTSGDNDRAVIVEELEPWDEPVDGAEILGEIKNALRKYLIMDEPMFSACTLWALLTYTYDCFRVLPLLGITSPEKRCGKTTLLEVLHGLVKAPLLASNISPAAIFRVIESYRPCLLIDEADTFTKDNDELRGIINSGHTKQSAFVIRVNTETLDPERFSTWGPKCIAMIGQLSDTNRDRAIEIRLKRKMPGEQVARLPLDLDDQHEDLRRKCLRWAQDHLESLKNVRPDVPGVGNDRAVDNWGPLFSIADVAGGEWPKATKKAMLSIEAMTDNNTIRQELLMDVKMVLENNERISSKDLVEKLIEMDSRPWADWRRGKPITQTGLARLLKPFGISSKTIRFDGKTAKGYEKRQFQDAFDRYLAPTPPFQSVTPSQVNTGEGFPPFSKRNTNENVTDEKTRKVNRDVGCDVVTAENAGMPVKGVSGEQKSLFDRDAAVVI